MSEPTCYTKPAVFDLSLGLFLIVGTVISFLPQHYSLLRRRSHLGISFMWLWINNLGNFCNTFNDVLDQWKNIECCSQIGPWQCTEMLLVFLQLGINWCCIFFVFVLALVFFDYSGTVESYNQRLTAWLGFVFYIFLVGFGIGMALVFTLFMDPYANPARGYSYTLGIVSAIIPVFVWTPQLYTTYKLKGPGSLSLTMQVIQTPGSFILAFNQIWSGQWLVGMTAAISGFEQLLLVLMCTYFLCKEWLKNRREKKEGVTTPLLKDGAGDDVGKGFAINETKQDGEYSTNGKDTNGWHHERAKVIEEVDQEAPSST